MMQNMIMYDDMIGLHPELLDVEGNNILHYVLFNIDKFNQDPKDVQSRIEFLGSLQLDYVKLAQQQNK